MKLFIDEVFAFISQTEEGEGVIGMQIGDMMYPFMGADMARVKILIPYADQITKATGIPYKIVKFTNRVDVTKEVKDEE